VDECIRFLNDGMSHSHQLLNQSRYFIIKVNHHYFSCPYYFRLLINVFLPFLFHKNVHSHYSTQLLILFCSNTSTSQKNKTFLRALLIKTQIQKNIIYFHRQLTKLLNTKVNSSLTIL
jgi:hypothetical protein